MGCRRMTLRQRLPALTAKAIVVALISWLIVDGLRALGATGVQHRADRATEATVEVWRDGSAALAGGGPPMTAQTDRPTSPPLWRHKERGSTYWIVGKDRLQADRPLEDMAELFAYVGEDGQWWFRTPEEFNDGRFEELSSPSAPQTEQPSGEHTREVTLMDVMLYESGKAESEAKGRLKGRQETAYRAAALVETSDRRKTNAEIAAAIRALADDAPRQGADRERDGHD